MSENGLMTETGCERRRSRVNCTVRMARRRVLVEGVVWPFRHRPPTRVRCRRQNHVDDASPLLVLRYAPSWCINLQCISQDV